MVLIKTSLCHWGRVCIESETWHTLYLAERAAAGRQALVAQVLRASDYKRAVKGGLSRMI